MIYLVGQLAGWLILTAAFAALAGWVVAAERAAPERQALRREREGLLRDLALLANGQVDGDRALNERETDGLRRLLQVRDGRVTELENALQAARDRANEAASRIAELERAPALAPEVGEELEKLRLLVRRHDEERAKELIAEANAEGDAALQTWRLRYFEQRVAYLEGKRAASSAPAPAQEAAPVMEWRARDAEARAVYLEQEVRSLAAPAAPVESDAAPAFAANAGVDALLRWRMLYLERRVAHLQGLAALTPAPDLAAPDPDRWKWRARYLEARLRHLERRPAADAPGSAALVAPAPTPPEPARTRAKPPVLSGARNGAPDDFTLIEGVSTMQQTTLYSLGIFHFDQVAAWTPEHVAWVDQYLRLQGRIDEEEWVEQADALVRHGVGAARRALVGEDA